MKIKTVKMYGPCLKDPTKTVNRDIPEADVQAYKAAGYKLGSVEIENYIEEVTPEVDDLAVVEAPKAKKKK